MFIYFLGVKLCKYNVLHNPSSSQHYDRSHYSGLMLDQRRRRWTHIQLAMPIIVCCVVTVGLLTLCHPFSQKPLVRRSVTQKACLLEGLCVKRSTKHHNNKTMIFIIQTNSKLEQHLARNWETLGLLFQRQTQNFGK